MYPTEIPVVNVMFRGKPIDALSREEAIEALKQALQHIATIEGRGQIEYVSAETGEAIMIGLSDEVVIDAFPRSPQNVKKAPPAG